MTTADRSAFGDDTQSLKVARTIDTGFFWLTAFFALAIAGILLWIVYELFTIAWPAIQKFGLEFLTSSRWNPVENIYGALPQIYGTIISSIIALLVAVPLGVGVAIFLSEDFLPSKVVTPIAFLIELLAAVPSVVYGLWGIFVFIPFITPFLDFIHTTLGWIPIFSTPPSSRAMIHAGLVLAIMISPIIISISRDTLASLPPQLRQGSLALGATRWETILQVLIPAGLSGIIGSIMLALGRALGETMAAAMLIGNANKISISWFDPASTIASLIANQFAEASGLQVSSLLYAGLVLMLLTLAVNVLAEIIVSRFQEVE
ncbi:MAG TPA: phosphate ABC transporter permease subunit PstC [Synechococcales cyanobacterium M55_K2018_004]|nr:phosphate ABC transporter permease subunit PstC [Synechococcales cyanobacterium M55_K2018_004]